MNFPYIVGRFFPKKKERIVIKGAPPGIEKIVIKAAFHSLEEAKDYAKTQDLSLSLNSIMFIKDERTKDVIFLSSMISYPPKKQWKGFYQATYYNCNEDDDIMLEEAMEFSEFKKLLEAAMQCEEGQC